MSNIKFEVKGYDDIIKNLKRLSEMTSEGKAMSAIRKGAKDAMEPVKEKAKQYVPFDEGELEASIKLRNSIPGRTIKKRRGDIHVHVVARAPHAHLVEYGTGPRQHQNGKYVGEMPPDPYMRPALEEEAENALKTVEVTVAKQVQAAIKKAGG